MKQHLKLKNWKFQNVFDLQDDDFKKLFKVGYVFTKNNDRYIITKINTQENEITIETDWSDVKNLKDNFQKLFRVGYAFTTHSCQGMTINEPYTIHDFDRMHKKLNYVALSRATKKDNINIM